MELLVFLVIIIILGALLGGKSFGDTIRKGCGCSLFLVILMFALLIITGIFLAVGTKTHHKITPFEQTYFIAKQDCETYTKPDIKSDTTGYLRVGEELTVENTNLFNYFYKITDKKGKSSYVRKECLVKKRK